MIYAFKPRTAFLIRSLHYGGAERQLVELAKGLASKGIPVSVLTFYSSGGDFESEILNHPGIKYFCLAKKSRWDVLGFGVRLVRTLRQVQPQILHSYLASANILAVLVRPFLRKTRIVWGVRSSNMDLNHYDFFSRLLWKLEIFLSRGADRIIANSRAGRKYVVAAGFPESKVEVISNGIDVERFRIDSDLRARTRQMFGFSIDQIVVGYVSRLDPMKDHSTFFKAVFPLLATQSNLRVLILGLKSETMEVHFKGHESLRNRFHWVGSQRELTPYYNAMDIFCSSSKSEGFPNTVSEAMACGIPCAVTMAGDSAFLVGDWGNAVPISDAPALSKAIYELIELLPQEAHYLASGCRQRILDNFSTEKLVECTERELIQLMAKASPIGTEVLSMP